MSSERKIFFQMAKKLVEHGYDVTLVVPQGSPYEKQAPLFGIKPIVLKGLREEFLDTIYYAFQTN